MARSHGRIMASIWAPGSDFTQLPGDPQRLYMFLVSQPDLSHAGLMPLRIRRWAASAADWKPETVRDALSILEAARYVVVDEDTEELLIRTFVRNDGVHKQPKVMVRMGEDARQMMSPKLRAVFGEEMRKLPPDEMTADSQRVVASLVAEFTETTEPQVDTPGEGYREAYPRETETVSGTPGDTPTDTPLRAGARTTRGPLPPTPLPNPLTAAAVAAPVESVEVLQFEVDEDPRPEANPIQALVAAYVEAVEAGGGVATSAMTGAIGRNVKRLIEKDRIEPAVLLVAVQRAGTARSKTVDTYLGSARQTYDRGGSSRQALLAAWNERYIQPAAHNAIGA